MIAHSKQQVRILIDGSKFRSPHILFVDIPNQNRCCLCPICGVRTPRIATVIEREIVTGDTIFSLCFDDPMTMILWPS